MPDAKPMDPERLADLRECLGDCPATLGFPLQSFTRELLAERDHWEAERRRVSGVLARVREIAGAPGDELDDEYTAEARKIELIREALAGLDSQEPEA